VSAQDQRDGGTEHERSDEIGEALTRLETQVTALGAEVRRLGTLSSLPSQNEQPPPPSAYAWVGALDVPVRRRPQVPRLLLEALFLAAAAAAAAIADLDAVAIAGVMIGAWVLVALIEWAASRADRSADLPVFTPAPAAAPGADPAWFSPPVEQTLLETRPGESVTEVTRLPPPVEDVESTAERRPAV
jgi:hypothetical protein